LEGTLNIRRSRNNAFNNALTLIQTRLTIVNAVFIIFALGFKGSSIDYLIATAYLIWSIALFFLNVQVFITRFLRPVLPFFDLLVTGYMVSRTGGIDSALYSFLYIPALVAIVRSRYAGMLAWTTVVGVVFTFAAQAAGAVDWVKLGVKIGYIYLFGFFGVFLIDRTYMVAEEVSNQLARKNNDLKRLTTDLNRVSGSSDLEQIFEQTMAIIQQNLTSSMLAVMVFNERGDLKIVRANGWSAEDIQRYNHFPLTKYSLSLAPVMAFKRPLLNDEFTRHTELLKAFEGISVRSFFAFPLIVQEEVVGIIAITDPQLRSFAEEDVDIVMSIVNQAGIAIQNVLSFKEEQKKANTDGLTGLYNRRYFNEHLELLARSGLQEGFPVSLILMDVDNFKKYNDTFGHPAGDVLLRKVAQVVMDSVREEDIPARYGGEEFAVILPNLENHKALEVAERIRGSIEGIWDLKRPVTVSVGVATIPDQGKNWMELIEFADKSLYYAKNIGKNRVCSGYKPV